MLIIVHKTQIVWHFSDMFISDIFEMLKNVYVLKCPFKISFSFHAVNRHVTCLMFDGDLGLPSFSVTEAEQVATFTTEFDRL